MSVCMAFVIERMEILIDFLTLKLLVTPYLLLSVYWFGAFVAPIVGWVLALMVCRTQFVTDTMGIVYDYVPSQVKLFTFTVFLMIFFSLELFWRLLFEFLIAYYNIHDALLAMAQ